MKRLIISLTAAALALSLAVFSYFDVKKNCKKMTYFLEKAIEAVNENDNEDFRAQTDNAVSVWKVCRGRFELYLYSGELFEIDLNFDTIEKLSGSQAEELKKLCYENINLLQRLDENQSPTFGKIF